MRTKRRAAAALAVLAVLALLLSAALAVLHSDGDCAGEGCPVCGQIAALARLSRLISAAAAVILSASLLSALLREQRRGRPRFAAWTPVSLRVKLSD